MVGAQGAQPPTVSIRESAASLVRSGIASNDARTVLAAAQLLITAERASPGLQRVGPVPADTSRPEEQTKSGVFTPAGLLRLASRIAVEQQDVTTARVAAELAANSDVGLGDSTLAKELRTAAQALAQSRGAAGGPIWADGFIGANEAAEYKVSFQGGYAPNKINVSASNASADLDCYLYDGKAARRARQRVRQRLQHQVESEAERNDDVTRSQRGIGNVLRDHQQLTNPVWREPSRGFPDEVPANDRSTVPAAGLPS